MPLSTSIQGIANTLFVCKRYLPCADVLQAENIINQVRQADSERFALESAGDDFEGKKPLFGNLPSHRADNRLLKNDKK